MSATRIRRLAGLVVLIVFVAAAASPASAGRSQTTPAGPGPMYVNDPAVTSGLAWNLDAIRARIAWRSSLGEGVIVAVVDSGIDDAQPDLLGQVENTISCIGAAGDPKRCKGPGLDSSGHGTHVAGLVAARADDQTGGAGVAPRAKLLSVRALRATCHGGTCAPSGNSADLAAGVRWAVQHKADIINLSITTERRLGPDLNQAISEAWDAGAITVMAAGNRSDQPLFFDTGHAVVVTATDRAGHLATYAPAVTVAPLGVAAPGGSRGDTVDTCHVGGRPVGILSTYARSRGDRSGYACLAGTSMAAPQVSGGLALLLSMGFDRDEALERLITTATPGPGLGAGLIDLAAAVATPYPNGVRNRHDSFANGVSLPELVSAPTVGPFSVPRPAERAGPPLWMAMVGGGIGLAVLTEVGLRLATRRRRTAVAGAAGPDPMEGSDDPGSPRDDHGGRSSFPPIPATPPLAPPGDPVADG